MKVSYSRRRIGGKLEKAPKKGITVFDDNNDVVGQIDFSHTEKHGMEIIVYAWSPELEIKSWPYTPSSQRANVSHMDSANWR